MEFTSTDGERRYDELVRVAGRAVGPDGEYYVGQLTGGPFAVGIANVYRVPPEGGDPEVFESGFTNIVDIAVETSIERTEKTLVSRAPM